VLAASKDNMFKHLTNNDQIGKINFIMTNPPFFSDSYNDSFEDDTKKPHNSTFHQKKLCSSIANEAVVEGGEVAFVKQIVEESLQTNVCIDIYTVMLGKRKSFLDLKYLFKDYAEKKLISSFTYTELCQGNTKRWALAWSFSKDINLTNAPRIKCIKAKPLKHYVPTNIECCEYNMKSIADYIQSLMNDLQICTFSVIETKKSFEFDIKSNINTWTNQRRKRRQLKLKEQSEKSIESDQMSCCVPTPKRGSPDEGDEMSVDISYEEIDSKRLKAASSICKADLTILLHCGLKIKREKQQIYLKMVTKEMSQNKDSTYEILQYFKNKLV